MMDILAYLTILGELLVVISIFGIINIVFTNYLCLSPQKKLVYYLILGGIGGIMMNYI